MSNDFNRRLPLGQGAAAVLRKFDLRINFLTLRDPFVRGFANSPWTGPKRCNLD
jgi:hypothetical protein